MPTKVLVVGLDAMEPSLVVEWMAEGSLPNFKKLAEQGLWAPVHNPPRRFNGASWPNFYTGAQPRSHGQYLRTVFDTDRYAYTGVRPRQDRVEPFWMRNGWRDKRVAVLNLPYAPLTPELNGIQLVEWGVHDYHANSPCSAPATFAREVISRFGALSEKTCEIENRSAAAFADFRDGLKRRTRAKRDLACKLLTEADWDLFITVLDECHCCGHESWHLHDTAHPLHDPGLVDALGNPLKQVYQELDEAVGALVGAAGEDVVILVLSSHGMGPTSDGNLTLGEILRRIEVGVPDSGTQAIDTVKRLLRHAPAGVLSAIKSVRLAVALSMNERIRQHYRARRRYFDIYTQDPTGGVRLNLVGRESQGIVKPGAEQEAVISELTSELMQLADGASGARLVEQVRRAEDIDYVGSGYEGSTPDLIIEWAVKSPRTIVSPRIGSIKPMYNSRTGDHRMNGFLVATGPGIGHGHFAESIGMEDFVPTLTARLGLDPVLTEGRLIAGVAG